MKKRIVASPRSTLCLSAGLIFLPVSGLTQPAASGWSCHVGPDNAWICDTASGTPPLSPPVNPAASPALIAPAPKIAVPATAVSTPNPPSTPKALPAAIAATANADSWDYVSLEHVKLDPDAQPEGACCAPQQHCRGYYREPASDWQDANLKPTGLPMRANAAESEWEGNTVKLDGAIIVTQGDTKLTAASGELDRAANIAKLHGDVTLRQPGSRITGTEAEFNTQTSNGTIHNAHILDYRTGARGTAQTLRRKGDELVVLEKATYTTCPPDGEDWRLSADHIRLNRETGRGVASHTVLRVADIPVFYSPYFDFPIDKRRQSGFLWPTIVSTSSGLDVSVPYYLNLAPNYDATLTPRVVTDRGTMLEAEARILSSSSNWLLSGTDMPDDRRTGQSRWLGGIQESGALNSNWSTSIDYTKVSDVDYFHDLGTTSLSLRRATNLPQQAALFFHYSDWYAQAQVQQFQTIDPFVANAYSKLPQLTFGRNAGAENFTLDYSVLAEVTRFDHKDSIGNGGTFVTGDRYYAEPGVTFPMRWPAGYIQPEVRLRHVNYNLDEAVPGGSGNAQPSASQFQGIVDSGLYFDRDTEFSGTAYHQTLEPRLYYLYSPYTGQGDQPNFDSSPLTFNYQQLFQPRRFTGHDRLEDFDQASLGVTSRFIENASGRESFSASLGQIFYFSDRQITTTTTTTGASQTVQTQPNSAVAGQLTWEPSDPLWASANVLWDTDNSRIEQSNAYIHYDAAHGALYNFGYRHSRVDPLLSTLSEGIDQVDFSTVQPLSQNWRLLGRFNYELNQHSAIENLAGIEYEDCCWAVRLIYQKAIIGERLNNQNVVEPRRDEIIMLEFQLKGLGSMGQQTEQQLKESIWGFR